MLDPVEQKKGGFRAFAARDREREDARAADAARPVMPDIIAVTPGTRTADGNPPTESTPATRADKTTSRPPVAP